MTHSPETTYIIVERLALIFGILIFLSTNATAIEPISVDLHSYGYPSGPVAPPSDVFYISPERIALYFDRGEVQDSPSQDKLSHSHQFLILIISTTGHVLAQQTIYGFPKALDIKAGPNGGLIIGRAGSISFYDADLHLTKSMPLSPNVTGVSFDRRWNQLVIADVDRTYHRQTIHLLDGITLEGRRDFTFPEHAAFKSGNREIAFTVAGHCESSTQILSKERSWDALRGLPICGMLTFVGDDALAYVDDQQLYVTNHLGNQLIRQSVPASWGTGLPFFCGISDDNSRIAVSVSKLKVFRKPSELAEYEKVLVYDLGSHKKVFSHSLPSGDGVSKLSPNGRQLAAIEDGVLMLSSVP